MAPDTDEHALAREAFMRERDIRLALAIDEDFSMEGFETLPRSSSRRSG